jgi:hypothetical protein
MMPHDLQRHAFTGLVNKVGLDKSTVDYICAGTVIQVSLSHCYVHRYCQTPLVHIFLPAPPKKKSFVCLNSESV